MYRLSSSMSDRINFNKSVRNWARKCAQYAEGPLTDVALEKYRTDYLDAVDVDDIEEAAARFDSEFLPAWKQAVLDSFADQLEAVKGPVRVFDTGLEIFGDFQSGAEAAEAVRCSNLDWWVMQELPTWERPEEK